MRQCLTYKPAFGTSAPVSELEFVGRYAADFFYNSVGLAIEEMYIAHKAAGGITSFYRQLGVACEVLTQSVFIRELGIIRADVRWTYQLATGGVGSDRTLTLDARLAPNEVTDEKRRQIIQQWLLGAATAVNIEPNIAKQLNGAVFEVRQGYKSADSKRQNADLSFGIHALKAGYLPCLLVFSGQISEAVAARYRNAGLYVLLGSSSGQAHMDTREFFRDVIGWDLVNWLDTNGAAIRAELELIVKYLLS